MKTRKAIVSILKTPLVKFDVKNRATETDPIIVTRDGDLMITKLRKILRDYGENVAINNSLLLEILDSYCKKSKKLKKLEKENMELRKALRPPSK
ncbi:MAG: hypothetical protein MJ154_00880 [Candidatus Saccharibacteria bacterium]|nr:hypothetical protein [Candidatus Saccharibacteria bacterium]